MITKKIKVEIVKYDDCIRVIAPRMWSPCLYENQQHFDYDEEVVDDYYVYSNVSLSYFWKDEKISSVLPELTHYKHLKNGDIIELKINRLSKIIISDCY